MTMMLKIAWRNVWRNPRRTLLTMGAIGFACVLLIFMLSLQFGSYATMINATLRLRSGQLQIQAAGYHEQQRMWETVDHPDKIKTMLVGIPAIQAVTSRANGFALVSSSDRSIGVLITGVDPQNEPKVTRMAEQIRSGGWFTAPSADEAVIGSLLADNLNVRIGDELTLLGQGKDGSIAAGALTVKGIFTSGVDEMDRNTLLMPLRSFQDLFSMQESVHIIVVNAVHLDDVPRIRSMIAQRLSTSADGKNLVVLDWKTLNPGLMESITMDLSMGIIMYAILIIVVAFSILNTFLMVIFERTHEFGVLLALGTTPGRLIRVVLSESMLIAASGIVFGLLLGILLTGYFQVHGIDLSSQGDLLEQYGISGLIYPRLSLLSIFAGPMAVLLVTFLAALFPAVRLGRVSPASAITHR